MQKQVSPKIVALTFGVLVISFLAAFYVVAWQEPSQAPPEGNVLAPLNVGPTGQSKEGGLILNTGGAEYGLIVEQGQTVLKNLATPFIFGSGTRPDPPALGQFYFDQTDNALYYYNGVMWRRIDSVPSGTGDECTAPGDCPSGFCVDGYCCDSACDTTCSACNVPGLEGTCVPLDNYAEDSYAPNGGVCDSTCSGCVAGECQYVADGSKDEVGQNKCINIHYRCNGSGSCTAPKDPPVCVSGNSCSSLCGGYDITVGCYKFESDCVYCHYETCSCSNSCGYWEYCPNLSCSCQNYTYD